MVKYGYVVGTAQHRSVRWWRFAGCHSWAVSPSINPGEDAQLVSSVRLTPAVAVSSALEKRSRQAPVLRSERLRVLCQLPEIGSFGSWLSAARRRITNPKTRGLLQGRPVASSASFRVTSHLTASKFVSRSASTRLALALFTNKGDRYGKTRRKLRDATVG
jgi:hypothetical protein